MKKDISIESDSSSIYSQIKELLFSGEILYRERFTEAQISERLKVSRMPVREAIKLLSYEGFIEKHESTGYQIKTFSEQDIIDTYVFRECIDGMLTNLFVQKHTSVQLFYLESILEKMEEQKDSGNELVMSQIDQEFHKSIARGAGNSQMLAQLELLLEKTMFINHILFLNKLPDGTITTDSYTKEHSQAVYEEHKEIYKCIKTGSPDEAEKCIRKSIKDGLKKTLSILASRNIKI